MKNYQIKDLLRKEILIVEIATGLSQIRKNTLSVLEHDGYTLLGKPDEIREEDVKDLVKVVMGKFYMNYNDDETDPYYTALESFFSALESEIYWDVNPLGFEPKNIITGHGSSHLIELVANSFYQSWKIAQEKTFDRNRSIIFVKN